MAFVGKPNIKPRLGVATFGRYHAARVAQALPQTTSDILFRVRGGKIRIQLLVGTVTTAIAATDPIIKITAKALDNAGAAIGTAIDVGTTVDISSLEVGGMVVCKGDATALLKALAGSANAGTGAGAWIMPQGEIYLTTGANKTGAIKWDLVYEPLEEGAFVSPNGVQVAI